jgi:hypothetical protein
MKKIKGHENLMRDDNGAVLTVSMDEYRKHKAMREKQRKMLSMERRMDRLEKQTNEISSALNKIIEMLGDK